MAGEIARRQQYYAVRQNRNGGLNTVERVPAPSRRASDGPKRVSRPSNGYSPPTGPAKPSGNSIGALEAEYFACLLLIFLTIFTDTQSTYSAKMLAVMKRGTLASVLFFILALMSAGSENMARFSKALGALVLAGIFLGTAGQGTISALDTFFKADWTSGDTTQGDSSSAAPAGQQTTGSGKAKSKLQQAEQAMLNAINRVGSGFTGTGSSNPFIKSLEQLLGAL